MNIDNNNPNEKQSKGCKSEGSHKILIAFASKFGSTGEVAEAIGEVLCQQGNAVETKWVKNVKDLNNYDAVSIGGFTGVLDYSNMGFFSRLMMKVILYKKGVKEGDYRDWEAIRSWAKGVHFSFKNFRNLKK